MPADVTLDSMLCAWPSCGAAGCDSPATLVDDHGVGWCDEHEDDALSICQTASDIAVFDPEWLWAQQASADDCPRNESGGPL